MSNNYRKIDLENWNGLKHYLFFKEYDHPYYLISSEIDLTTFYKYIKANGHRFYVTMLYLVTKALNRVEEFRLRMKDDEVRLYEVINPAFTIMTNDGVFDNCVGKMFDKYSDFINYNLPLIEKAKLGLSNNEYNSGELNEYYISPIPWISIKAHTHPMSNNKLDSFPRISWDKMVEVDGKYKVTLTIQVNHALIDGYPLSKGFIEIQNALNNIEEELS